MPKTITVSEVEVEQIALAMLDVDLAIYSRDAVEKLGHALKKRGWTHAGSAPDAATEVLGIDGVGSLTSGPGPLTT